MGDGDRFEWPPMKSDLTYFLKGRMAEIDAAYAEMQNRLSENMFMFMGPTPPPPKRWSRRWWHQRWWGMRSALVRARRRVGMWIGGIDPSELECDC